MLKNQLIYLPFLILLSLFSCNESTNEKGLSQGIIEYEVAYPDEMEGNMYSALLPKTMLFKFKDGKIAFEMSGAMGLFKTSFITGSQSEEVLHLLMIRDKKYAIRYSGKDLKALDDFNNLKITHTGEHIKIAGYDCQKALISLLDDENTSFEVYYTNDLKIQNPNWNTPYRDIDGVLMKYRLKRYDKVMEFTATKVRKAEVGEEEFKKPDSYEFITKEEARKALSNPFN
jgi:GLPGLI family protein